MNNWLAFLLMFAVMIGNVCHLAAAPPAPPLPETPPVKPEPKAVHLIKTFKHDRPMWSCRFDPSGTYVFGGAHDAGLHRWNLSSGEKVTFKGHRSWIRRFAFHPNDSILVSGGYSGGVLWWETEANASAKPMRKIDAHRGYVRAVALSPNGQFLATGGNDLVVRIWDANSGKLVKELSGHKRHVYNIAFHPDGKHLVTGDLMGVLKKWEVGTWKPVFDFQGTDILVGWDRKFQSDCGGIRGIDFSPDGKTLAIAGITEVSNAFAGIGKPTVVLFDWQTGKRLRVMKPKTKITGHCWGVKWHRSGEFLVGVCGSSSGYLCFFKPNETASFHDYKLPSVAYDVDIHPDGLRIAVALYNKSIGIYDLSPKKPSAKKKK
ncbi:MAG: hypothetical protein Tsb009_09750 [Planctomycetaceae bacterium]